MTPKSAAGVSHLRPFFSKTSQCRHFKRLSPFNVEPLIFFKTLILPSSRGK